MVCGDVDECPYDADNDADQDGICGDVDICPGLWMIILIQIQIRFLMDVMQL